MLVLETDRVQILIVVMIVLAMVCVFILWFSLMNLMKLWMQALFANAKVSFAELIGMRLRKTDPKVIVVNRIVAVQAGLDLTTRDLESNYIAGVNISKVVRALIVAKRNGISLSLEEAAKRDLAGRDVLAEIQAAAGKVEPATEPQKEEPRPRQDDDELTDVLGHEKSI